MDTIRDSDVHMQSGSEVESASPKSTWKEKAKSNIGSLRSSASRIKPMVSDKLAGAKPKVNRTISTVSSKMNELRRNPLFLAGLASAAGLALGLAGRWMRHRAHAPMLLIIDAC